MSLNFHFSTMSSLLLAVEDVVSEVVCRRIIEETGGFEITVMGRKGNAYLKERATELYEASRGQIVMLVTDQDVTRRCPASLWTEWLGSRLKLKTFHFCVAVMEIEAWLLADSKSLATFLCLRSTRVVPMDVEALIDPKGTLVAIARRSKKRAIREAMAPIENGTARIGPEYNAYMTTFARDFWNPAVAAEGSASLRRAVQGLRRLRGGSGGR